MSKNGKSPTVADVRKNPTLYPQEYRQLTKFGKQLSENFIAYEKYTSESIQKIVERITDVGERLKDNSLTDFFEYTEKNNFMAIIDASEGLDIGSQKLAKVWHKMYAGYKLMEEKRGRKPTKKDFQDFISVTCWEVVKRIEHKPISENLMSGNLQRYVFFLLSDKIVNEFELAQHEGVSLDKYNNSDNDDFNNSDQEIPLATLNNFSFENIKNKIYTHDQKPFLFLKTVAVIANVSDRTVRNWIKDGIITAEKILYPSRLKQKMVDAYVIPYNNNLYEKINAAKEIKEKNHTHKIEGYITTGELAILLHMTVRKIQRDIKANKIEPTMIKNRIAYFSREKAKDLYNNRNELFPTASK